MALVVAVWPASARELNFLGGIIKNTDDDELSRIVQVEYRVELYAPLDLSVSYLNEGHFDTHHRDGLAGQLWLRHNAGRLVLAAGAGPYFYCDTRDAPPEIRFYNDKGVGVVSSLMLQWPVNSRLNLQLRSNWIVTGHINTCSILMGIGGRFDVLGRESMPAFIPAAPAVEQRNEITLFSGVTIVNSFSSRRTVPVSLEYRRGIGRHFEWTVSGLYEGDNVVINRYGPATQIWVIDTLGDWPLRFGLGAGVYYASDNAGDGSEGLAGLVSLTGSWQFHPQYNLRVNWHRVVSDYDRDTDVILAGFGRVF